MARIDSQLGSPRPQLKSLIVAIGAMSPLWVPIGAWALLALAACSPAAGKAGVTAEAASYALTVSAVDRTFHTRDHFIAGVEMQLAGEPLAEAMGRDVHGYNRNYVCQQNVCSPDSYVDPQAPAARSSDAGAPQSMIDLAGFSSAIESYEYSKQPMNNVAFESGAGTSLLFGPLFNPSGARGEAALEPVQAWITRMADASNATAHVQVTADNPLGWPGLWLTLQPFASWDPSIQPSHDGGCSLSSDDNPGRGAYTSDIYECDYNSLHLPDREHQVVKTIDPGSSGWSDWKEALWTLNYLQVMHDIHENPIDHVVESRMGLVGMPGNTIGPSNPPGTYLGSSNIEGFQAGNFLQILDNQAAQWLLSLTTTDGKTLSGFASLGDALAYAPDSPLRWFPSAIDVTEVDDDSGFPRPDTYAIATADSHLLDLAGLLGAYASVYALTDQGNRGVGGSQPAQVFFDGDPLPLQNQTPSGEDTLHDRALAMMRVTIVNIDRLHFGSDGSIADDASIADGKATRGSELSSDVAAYTLLALRTARRALDAELTLYANTAPDTQRIPCPLDRFQFSDGVTLAQRLDQLIQALSDAFYDELTSPDGRAFGAWDRVAHAATDQGQNLDAHSAALRGLLIAHLATGATKYRDRALDVFQRLERVFYDPHARIYRASAGDRSDQVTFSDRRFGLLQGALRDSYELLALQPGHEDMRALIEARIARLNKLVLNGWDDRDGDQKIEWPDECAQQGTGPDGMPLGLGGLQMAERSLTGESGALPDPGPNGERVIATDRDHDCVPEISAVGLPAALASSVTFALKPMAAAQDAGEVRP